MLEKGSIVVLKNENALTREGYEVKDFGVKTKETTWEYRRNVGNGYALIEWGNARLIVKEEDIEVAPRICKECGEEAKYWISEIGYLCEECAENSDKVTKCEDCGDYVKNSETYIAYKKERRVRNGYSFWETISIEICDDCRDRDYEMCECCEEIWSLNWMESTRDGYACNACVENYYHECADCGDLCHEDELRWDDEEEEYYCNSCWEGREPKVINNYSYKPNPIFKDKYGNAEYFETELNNEIKMGAELEIDKGNNPEKTAKEMMDASEDIYIKHDGSLTSAGMEIVTHPCELEYHTEKLGWNKICSTARKNNYLSQDAKTCGLHIHVGRKGLGNNEEERQNTIGKIVLLVSRHWDNLVKFSRRKDDQLSNWAARPRINYNNASSEEDLINLALATVNDGRYQAVNLTNYKTIEFRLWNGTLKVNTILATFEITNNICKYAKEHTTEECLASQWMDIVNFENHEELNTYIKERCLVAEETMPATTYKIAEFAW